MPILALAIEFNISVAIIEAKKPLLFPILGTAGGYGGVRSDLVININKGNYLEAKRLFYILVQQAVDDMASDEDSPHKHLPHDERLVASLVDLTKYCITECPELIG